jgi:hypothetical protein
MLEGTNIVPHGAQLVLVNWGAGFALLLKSPLLALRAVSPLVAAAPAPASRVYNSRSQFDSSYFMQQMEGEV